MLTQKRHSTSTTIYIDKHPNGYGVEFGGNFIGSFELYSVYELTDEMYTTARALGLDVSDQCYVIGGQVFITQAHAALQLINDYVASDMGDYN